MYGLVNSDTTATPELLRTFNLFRIFSVFTLRTATPSATSSLYSSRSSGLFGICPLASTLLFIFCLTAIHLFLQYSSRATKRLSFATSTSDTIFSKILEIILFIQININYKNNLSSIFFTLLFEWALQKSLQDIFKIKKYINKTYAYIIKLYCLYINIFLCYSKV